MSEGIPNSWDVIAEGLKGEVDDLSSALSHLEAIAAEAASTVDWAKERLRAAKYLLAHRPLYTLEPSLVTRRGQAEEWK